MTRRILINDLEPGEIRVAVLEEGRLEDLFLERENQKNYLGNIYKGKVVNLEPAIQAAFVDFGGDRNGFLHASDVMPRYADAPDDITDYEQRPHGKPPLIQDVLENGQDVLVQVTKDGIGKKGPTLTTYLSIPGKYMVLMPSLARIGVSKKVRDLEVRKRLKTAIRDMAPPEGLGVIVRTAGATRTDEELRRDLDYLLNLWDALVKRTQSGRAPATIYRESDLVIRTLRDLMNDKVEEIVIDSEEVYDQAREFLEQVAPDFLPRLKRFRGDRPLFHAYKLEEQIERLFQRKVPLANGGSLIIEQTEALVSIDVNSGRFKREADLEETAFQMNLEAVPEVCRQLRLRDLGGVIIIDMIDMRNHERRREVERKLRRELRKDKARVRVLPISDFGIVELTRQRVRPSLRQETYVPCRVCHGTGYVKSLESMILKVIRDIHAFARKGGSDRIEVTLPGRLASVLQNAKRGALHELEQRFGLTIEVLADDTLTPEEVQVRTVSS